MQFSCVIWGQLLPYFMLQSYIFNTWLVLIWRNLVPGMSGCPVIPMGGIPRLFIAVAQALGSDIGIVIELESIVMLQMPSAKGQTHTKRGKASVSVKWLLNHRDKRVTAEEEPCCGGDRGKRLFLSVQCCRGMSAKSVFCLRRGEARLRWPCSQSDHSDFSSTVTENLFFLVVCSVGAQRFNSLAFWHILPLWVCWNGTRCLRKAREGWGGETRTYQHQ